MELSSLFATWTRVAFESAVQPRHAADVSEDSMNGINEREPERGRLIER